MLIDDLKRAQSDITLAMRVIDEIQTEIDYQNDYINQVKKGLIPYKENIMERHCAVLEFCDHLMNIATRYTEIKGA